MAASSSLAEASASPPAAAVTSPRHASTSTKHAPGEDPIAASQQQPEPAQEARQTPDSGNSQPVTVVVIGDQTVATATDEVVPESSQSLDEIVLDSSQSGSSQPADSGNSQSAVDNAELASATVQSTISADPATEKQAQAREEEMLVRSNAPPAPPRRPSRAAAEASKANMHRLVQQEAAPMGIIITTSTDVEAPQHLHAKRRPTEQSESSDVKRSKVGATAVASTSKRAPQNTLEMASAGKSLSRGKKRRQAPVYEAAPIITDLPPLPFTTPSPKGKGKMKHKHKNYAAEQTDDDGSRTCDFCKKVANICVLMHCTACRRMYHAQCLVNTFKPYVEKDVPIEQQMEQLQLAAPDRRGGILRCVSCKTAFIDFYESGGHLWDCSCPTCAQPEKLIYYRQRKLVNIMNEMELERQRKKDKKSGKKTTSAKAEAPASNASRSSRRSRSGSNAPEVRSAVLQDELQPPQDGAVKIGKKAKAEPLDVADEMPGQQTKSDPLNELSVSRVQSAKDPQEPPELEGDDLVAAVRMRCENDDHWTFPVMCSRSASLRESGVMKNGTYIWHYKKHPAIRCKCCGKEFNCAAFVHHTDSSLVKNPKSAKEDPTPFLFVEQCDGEHFTPLEKFQPAWRSYHARQKVVQAKTKMLAGRAVKQESIATAAPVASTPANAESSGDALKAALSRLRALALFKRPRDRSRKFTMPAPSNDPPSMEFLAKVVCLPPKYLMTMRDGSLVDRVASCTPETADLYPRKVGWMGFSREQDIAAKNISRLVTCSCCGASFSLDQFLAHAGILNEEMKKPRQYLHVMDRQDVSAVMPFNTFADDMTLAASRNSLASILKELRLPQRSAVRTGRIISMFCVSTSRTFSKVYKLPY